MSRNSNNYSNARLSGRAIAALILIALAFIFACGFTTWGSWGPPLMAKLNQPIAAQPTSAAPSQNQPANQSGGAVAAPGSATQPPYLPGKGPKPTLKVAFPTFFSYLPVILIPPMNDAAYNIELIPISFQEAENATALNDVAEADQPKKMTSGEWDVLYTTTDTLAQHPGMGKAIDVIDRSDGADFTIAWNTPQTTGCAYKPDPKTGHISFNDLKGCKVGVAKDSVSEYQLDSWILAAGYTTKDFTVVKFNTMQELVDAFDAHKLDGYSGWQAPTSPSGAQGDPKGWTTLVSSAYLHTIYDGIFVSPNVIADPVKHAAGVAFLADWNRAIKMVVENPAAAATAIAKWQYTYTDPATNQSVTVDTNYWTAVSKDNAQADFTSGLSTIAEAGLDNNLSYVDNPGLFPDILSLNRKVWTLGGAQLDDPFDPTQLFDPSFLQAIRNTSGLRPTTGTFPDPTFSPFPPEQAQAPTSDQLIKIPTLVEFNCSGVYFPGGQSELDKNSDGFKTLKVCVATLRQLLNQSDANILITGSAAHPDPTKYGAQYTEQYSLDLAHNRALWAQSALIDLGIPGNRIAIYWVAGPLTQDQAVMQDARFVTLDLKPGSLR